MRIGIFTDTYTPHINGVVTSTLMLKNGLEKLGHKVYIITVNPNSLHFGMDSTGTILRIPGIPIGIYDYRLTGICPAKAIKQIKKWHLDVIHSQTEFGIGTFARIVAKQFRIPLVHTYHTMYEEYVYYITHGYFDKTSRKIVEHLTIFYCDKTIDELIVPTKKAWELFKEKYMVDRNVHIIPTGIDIDRFKLINNQNFNKEEIREQLNIKPNDFVLLFVGRIAKEKNVIFLLDNMKKLSKFNSNIKLLVVGDGPEFIEYEKYAEENKLLNNVIFVGKVPWDEIPTYYLMSDIFVTPSVTETQGLTVIEAMASSLPVVCINDESYKNCVIDNLNGKVFNNDVEYINVIKELYNNKPLVNDLKNEAYNTAKKHSNEYFAKEVLNVYQDAIKNYSKKIIPILDKFKKI